MKKLLIAKGIDLPLDIVTQTIAILAKRRAGKSYTMRRLVEQLFKADQQVILVDPKGDQWGIRSSRNGKEPGLPIVILGGEHGDAPLEVNAGEVVAKLVVEERVSILLDLSPFRKHEVATFMTAFLENLYRLKAQEQYRTPCMLVIDEADAIAPQKPQKGEERMLGAAEDIVRRGGQRGIGCALITQRSAVLNKNVLTQAQMLVVLRTIAPQDLAAMKAWIDVHGDYEQGKTLMDSLPSLPVGDAWFWSPGWPTADGIFMRSHVLPIETFDSGATPAPGVKKIVPKNLADVDLEALKKQMSSTIEKAKNDDPKLLRKRIAELEKQHDILSFAIKHTHEADPTIIEKALAPHKIAFESVIEGHKREIERLLEHIEYIKNVTNNYTVQMQELDKNKPTGNPGVPYAPQKIVGIDYGNKDRSIKNVFERRANGTMEMVSSEEIKIGKGEILILKAIAQFPEGVTREHLTVMTGYKRSSRDAYIQRLMQKEYIETSGDQIFCSDFGREYLGSDYEPLPTGAALREHWIKNLPAGESKILELLISARFNNADGVMNREDISTATGYKRSSRDAYIQRLSVRKLVEIYAHGMVAASDKLF